MLPRYRAQMAGKPKGGEDDVYIAHDKNKPVRVSFERIRVRIVQGSTGESSWWG